MEWTAQHNKLYIFNCFLNVPLWSFLNCLKYKTTRTKISVQQEYTSIFHFYHDLQNRCQQPLNLHLLIFFSRRQDGAPRRVGDSTPVAQVQSIRTFAARGSDPRGWRPTSPTPRL